jgi:signal transduction histidine kinase
MNAHIQDILHSLQQMEELSDEQRAALTKSLKAVEKDIAIVEFKLDRTEKVKRTTAILLEETIEELELKRKAIEETNLALKQSLEELKSAQAQLVQQEKLASLGQLTAGIAHEIKNPLNFVNNFTEVSIELIQEVKEERDKNPEERDEGLLDEILEDIQSNLHKIHEHGTRANRIVTAMLLHSRGGSGKKELSDLNALIREYVNLSYHGMKAGKNPMDVDIAFNLDPDAGKVPLIKEDFSRVIINLCNNAFDACSERSRSPINEINKYLTETTKYRKEIELRNNYLPRLCIRTKSESEKLILEFEDNGTGIPDEIKDKILQPFFTTKKGTEGTGLGLSITNDIIKTHGAELTIETEINRFSRFTITFNKKDIV